MMQEKTKFVVRCSIAAALLAAVSSAAAEEPQLPKYAPSALPTETLTSVGSDSMDGLVNVWVEAYRRLQPNVRVQAVSRGSATAPPALIEGSADLGPMARPMKSAEREQFIEAYGFEPTKIRTALAAVAVYAAKGNPVDALAVDQLQQMFARQESGAASWKAVAKNSSLADQPVMVFGQNANTYLTGYFKQRVLRQEEFSQDLMTTAGHAALFEGLSMNPNGIGYGIVRSDFGDKVKMLAVRKDAASEAYLPTIENIVSGRYPISRFLNIYVVREPGKPLEPGLQDFLRFVLSEQGQSLVSRQGLIPLPPEVVAEELAKLD